MKLIETKSIFNFRVYLIPILISLFLIFGMIASIKQLIELIAGEGDLKKTWISLVFSLVFVLVFLHEFKNKIIKVTIANDSIEKRTYFGFNKIYRFTDFDGFQTRIVKGKFESYEYLYLIKDRSPIITISQTYHKNYYELKSLISNNLKNIGLSSYGLWNEIKDILTLK